MTLFAQLSTRNAALTAGLSLLLMAGLAGWAYDYVFGQIYVPGDAAQTATNLAGAGTLFSGFVVAFVGILILDVVVARALYRFFGPANRPLALLMAWLRIAYAAVLGGAIQPLLPLLPTMADAPSSDKYVLDSLNGFLGTWSVGLLVFGSHLLLLGWLVLQTHFVPKAVGILIVVGGICYVATNAANLLLPDYELYKAAIEQVLSLPMALAELALAGWLLAKGGRQRTTTQAS